MGSRTYARRNRFPAPQDDEADASLDLFLEEEDEAPCSEFVVMSQEPEMPALQEYLHERGTRTIH